MLIAGCGPCYHCMGQCMGGLLVVACTFDFNMGMTVYTVTTTLPQLNRQLCKQYQNYTLNVVANLSSSKNTLRVLVASYIFRFTKL